MNGIILLANNDCSEKVVLCLNLVLIYLIFKTCLNELCSLWSFINLLDAYVKPYPFSFEKAMH